MIFIQIKKNISEESIDNSFPLYQIDELNILLNTSRFRDLVAAVALNDQRPVR